MRLQLVLLVVALVARCIVTQPIQRTLHRRVTPAPPSSVEYAGLFATIIAAPGAVFGPAFMFNYINARGNAQARIQEVYYRKQRELINAHEALLRQQQLAKLGRGEGGTKPEGGERGE